mmetsp:Transcript_14661/g.21867  ORF Transcript_14661/g.21867 Transcript_14661/m.21867 type:complete len:179 (+) Transcript_14661:107-643(+)
MGDSTSTKGGPRLLHDSLKQIPLNIRFGLIGALSNVIFLTGYNATLHQVGESMSDAYVYSVFYVFYIPVGHALQCLFVWGWPDPYLPNLLSNAPIGLTAMALGTFLTRYLDQMNFNDTVDDFLKSSFSMGDESRDSGEEEKNYVSFAVMIATGLWSFILSNLINTPSKKSEKEPEKEL